MRIHRLGIWIPHCTLTSLKSQKGIHEVSTRYPAGIRGVFYTSHLQLTKWQWHSYKWHSYWHRHWHCYWHSYWQLTARCECGEPGIGEGKEAGWVGEEHGKGGAGLVLCCDCCLFFIFIVLLVDYIRPGYRVACWLLCHRTIISSLMASFHWLFWLTDHFTL